jgi:putative transposase
LATEPSKISLFTAFLKEAPTRCLQQSLKDLERAFINFSEKRSEFPRFHKKGRKDTFRFPSPEQFSVDDEHSRIKLPKMGWARYRNSRPVIGEPKNIAAGI